MINCNGNIFKRLDFRKGDILIVKANAKINLMLDITGVKKNGYHKLYTIMQSLSLCDVLKTERTAGEKIVISCSDEKIPTDRKNIAYKCAAAFFDAAKIESGRGVKIHIEKNIPSEAGMGGGSADGAAVLVALNKLFGEKLSQKELMKIGASVGADIPFILVGGTALCLDIGSVVAPLNDLSGVHFVIVKPDSGSNTREAYEAIDADSSLRHPNGEAMCEALVDGDTGEALRHCANIFEQVIEVGGRVDIKDVMYKCGAKAACMTGSGTAIFGAFLDKASAEKCFSELKKGYPKAYICEPESRGIEIIEE